MSVAISINRFVRRVWPMGLVIVVSIGLLLALEHGAFAVGGRSPVANGHWGAPVANGHWIAPVANSHWIAPVAYGHYG
jgi:hypothetical protein